MGWLTGCPARTHREGATRMSTTNGDTEARLHSLPSFPTETSRNGQCQAPALPNDAERLSAIIATQQEIATPGLDLGTVTGEVGGIILPSEKITARRQAEEALRQSEARIRSVLHNV